MDETDCGHGHVFRAGGGYRARCGGPGYCTECDADLVSLAARERRHPDAMEAELQACFDRARRGV